jgi:two-component system, OmpR family, phosphate regulon sensor histidine kinase PhoR
LCHGEDLFFSVLGPCLAKSKAFILRGMKNETRARLERIQKSLRLTGVIVALSVGVIVPVLLSTSVGIIALVLGEGSLSLVVGVLVTSFTSAAIGVAIVVMVILGKRARTARLQADLLANITHELRTPLSAIRMYAQTLELGEDALDKDRRRQCIDTIIRETDWLETTIDRILTWRSLAKDRVDLDLVNESVRDTVEQTAAHFVRMVPPDDLDFEFSVNSDRPVYHDNKGLGSVILNLLINAYKYTGEKKRIRLFAQDDGGHVVISVADNGIGIPKGEINRILQPFYRVDSRLRGKAPGAGLGLAVVSHMVHAHKGAMTVDSKEGEGSTFRVFLPVANAGG